MNGTNLRQADRLEVTVLVDNYSDLLMLQGTEMVKRAAFPPPQAPLAEHGFSCLLKVFIGAEQHTVLVDAGVGATALFHNAGLLNLDLSQVETVVLSHGHFDHFGSLVKFLNQSQAGTTLVLHPEAFLERRLNIPMIGRPTPLPSLDKAALQGTGRALHESKGPYTLASGLVLATGEVQRVVPFEKGFPWAEAKVNGEWSYDPFNDDQGVVVNVKGKGLVVIGGCSHAGIINTVKHAQHLTGTETVVGVLGGFHLTGPAFDPIIAPTIEQMKNINPQVVAPMHCTGWKAINMFAREMPGQFVLNTVGTTYVF